MIGSLFNDLQPNKRDEPEDSDLTENLSNDVADGDGSLLASLGVAQKIGRRKGLSFRQTEPGDIVQSIALRLIKWRDKYREKSAEMSPDDWQSFAARTAYNEINRQYKNNSAIADVPLDSVPETAADLSLEGQSEAEVCSLAMEVWQKICSLSLRQRQALLLGSQELVIYFLQCGITDEQLAENLNLTIEDWALVKERIPLKNVQIGEIIKQIGGSEKSIESVAKSIKKARHEARVKIRRVTEK